MTNFQVYKKTLSFSLLDFAVGLLDLALIIGLSVAGFFIGQKGTGEYSELIGLGVGLLIGLIITIFVVIFIQNRIKAAQIGMMTIGVTDDKLPDNTFKEGFNMVKGRFGKITVFFFVTNAIKGIFRQIGRGVTNIGQAVGGNVGGSVASAVDSAIQTLINYLCDCCLGWVMYHKDESAAKCACEGAVIFFKRGKTLLRNVGRIFGMGFLSFLVIGGAFFGLSYLVLSQFPQAIEQLLAAMQNGEGEASELITNPLYMTLFLSGIIAIVLWSMVHSVVGRPFILVGVLRNFMAAGLAERPTEQDFAELDAKSPRFAKMHKSI